MNVSDVFQQAAENASGTTVSGMHAPVMSGLGYATIPTEAGLGALSPAPAYFLTVAGAAAFGGAVVYVTTRSTKASLAGAALQGGAASALIGIWGKALDSTALRAGFGLAGLAAIAMGVMMVRRR